MPVARSFPLLLAASCLAGLAGCGRDAAVRGSGTLRTETRTAAEFTAIDVADRFHATVVQVEPEGVEITADDNAWCGLYLEATERACPWGRV